MYLKKIYFDFNESFLPLVCLEFEVCVIGNKLKENENFLKAIEVSC